MRRIRRPAHRIATALASLTIAAASLGATALATPANAAPEHPKRNLSAVSFTGTAALSNCSASVIRFSDSQPSDPAIGLTNGHCIEGGFPAPGEVITNVRTARAFTLLDANARSMGTVRSTTLLYATMTKTDMALYELGATYAQLEATYPGFSPLTLATQAPADGTGIAVVSGYWKRTYTCAVDSTIHELHEAGWVFAESIKYTQPGCEIIGGTSGSPIVNTSTGQVVGVNNTSNESGERCTINNPCEVAADGTVTVDQGGAYGQQTWWIYGCLDASNRLALSTAGCQLPS